MRWELAARLRAWLVLCAAGTCAATASAQVLISPVVVEMAGGSRPAVVTVSMSERAERPMRLQAQLLRWQQGPDGQPVTQPSDDLVVSPRIAEVRPGQRQVFRLAWRGTPPPRELGYRLVFEDVAEDAPADAATAAAIRFRMRYDLAVLVQPAGKPLLALRWRDCEAAGASTGCVRLVNVGTRRVKVETITAAGSGWEERLSPKNGASLLAGSEREWRLPMPAGARPTRLAVRTAGGETLDVTPVEQ
jgi:fimbrial chaperone protein